MKQHQSFNTNKNNRIKLYSQANDQKSDLLEMKKSIIESINMNQSSLFQSITDKLDKSELKIIQQVKNIDRDVQISKAKAMFIEIDKQKINNTNPNNIDKYIKEFIKYINLMK
jgi:hypothetical protein